MIKSAGLAVACLWLVACDPQVLADKAVRRAAESVVMPVVSHDMPSGPAVAATACILNAASRAELQLLARDVGVDAGSSTLLTIRTIARRPAAAQCFAAAGVPPLRG